MIAFTVSLPSWLCAPSRFRCQSLLPAFLAKGSGEADGEVVLQLPRVVRGVKPAARRTLFGTSVSSHATRSTRRVWRGMGEARLRGVGDAHPRACANPQLKAAIGCAVFLGVAGPVMIGVGVSISTRILG